MKNNKKRVLAFAGVIGMILALSCHMLHMPIKAKETGITLIENPVYTDQSKESDLLQVQNAGNDLSQQKDTGDREQSVSVEAFCRIDSLQENGKQNADSINSPETKKKTVMTGNVNTEQQDATGSLSSEQKVSDDRTQKEQTKKDSENANDTLLIPDQWNIEIEDRFHTEALTKEGQDIVSESDEDQQTDKTAEKEIPAEDTKEVKKQDTITKEQKKKAQEQKKKKAIQKRKKEGKKKKQKRAKACQAMAGSTTDRQILERIVEAEAGGETQKGKILVANVILNRVQHKEFPDTIKGVVFAHKGSRYQFSPIADGRYYKVHVSNDTKKAVRQALQGVDESRGALYFMERSAADSSNVTWFDTALTRLFRYGCHEFYK